MTTGFSDPQAVAAYIERASRMVPGLDVLHRLVDQVLTTSVPQDGRVLVVGAGGGLELTYLADRHAGWTFDGVDPSQPMLQLAQDTMGPHAARAALHKGDITRAPAGPFDAATCLLVLHFLTAEERLHALREIHRRLRPGAPLLTFHHSVPIDGPRTDSFERFAQFSAGPDAAPAEIQRTGATLATSLPIVGPAEDEQFLQQAGFGGVELFYTALTLRGWLASA